MRPIEMLGVIEAPASARIRSIRTVIYDLRARRTLFVSKILSHPNAAATQISALDMIYFKSRNRMRTAWDIERVMQSRQLDSWTKEQVFQAFNAFAARQKIAGATVAATKPPQVLPKPVSNRGAFNAPAFAPPPRGVIGR